MARKSLSERQKKRQICVKKYASLRKKYKNQMKIADNLNLRLQIQRKLQSLPKNSSPVRLHNRCAVTQRPKGYYRQFGLSRHILREMAHQGLLAGLTKSSW